MSAAQKSFLGLFGPNAVSVTVGEFTIKPDGTVERNGSVATYSRAEFMFEVFDAHGFSMIRERAELVKPNYARPTIAGLETILRQQDADAVGDNISSAGLVGVAGSAWSAPDGGADALSVGESLSAPAPGGSSADALDV